MFSAQIIDTIDKVILFRYYINMVAIEKAETLLLDYKESNLTLHQKDMQEIEQEVQSGKISIFSLSFFPWTMQPYKITPQQVQQAIISYQDSVEGIRKVLEKHGISYPVYYDLIIKYSEVAESHRLASIRKAKEYSQAAVQLYLDDIPQEFKEMDRYGVIKLSGPGIKYMRDKADQLGKQAAIHDRATYGEKQDINLKTISLNINTDLTRGEEQSLDGLIEIMTRK